MSNLGFQRTVDKHLIITTRGHPGPLFGTNSDSSTVLHGTSNLYLIFLEAQPTSPRLLTRVVRIESFDSAPNSRSYQPFSVLYRTT